MKNIGRAKRAQFLAAWEVGVKFGVATDTSRSSRLRAPPCFAIGDRRFDDSRFPQIENRVALWRLGGAGLRGLGDFDAFLTFQVWLGCAT